MRVFRMGVTSHLTFAAVRWDFIRPRSRGKMLCVAPDGGRCFAARARSWHSSFRRGPPWLQLLGTRIMARVPKPPAIEWPATLQELFPADVGLDTRVATMLAPADRALNRLPLAAVLFSECMDELLSPRIDGEWDEQQELCDIGWRLANTIKATLLELFRDHGERLDIRDRLLCAEMWGAAQMTVVDARCGIREDIGLRPRGPTFRETGRSRFRKFRTLTTMTIALFLPKVAPKADVPAGRRRPSDETVNEGMQRLLIERLESREWSARQFAFALDCSVSTIGTCTTWIALQSTRAGAKLERMERDANRTVRQIRRANVRPPRPND